MKYGLGEGYLGGSVGRSSVEMEGRWFLWGWVGWLTGGEGVLCASVYVLVVESELVI